VSGLLVHTKTWGTSRMAVSRSRCIDNRVAIGVPPSRRPWPPVAPVAMSSTPGNKKDTPATPVTIGLGPDGSPVGFALRDEMAAVPMGFVPALVVVDLATAEVTGSIGLPAGSGATGVDFLDDDRVLVANPGLNSVVTVQLTSGEVGPEIPVGVYPQHVRTVGDRVFVLNALLGPDFRPTGPGTITVLDAETTEVAATIQLSGVNPSTSAVGPDGLLYVVHSGNFGQGNGAVSVVDPSTLQEVNFIEGFGEFPGSAAFGPTGNLHVGGFGFGIAVWSPGAGVFTRAPDEAIAPEDTPSVAGLGFDAEGRLYVSYNRGTLPGTAPRLRPAE